MPLAKIIKVLKENNNFVITTHRHPDGDALGAELAVYFLLKRLKKNVVIFNEDKVSGNYSFLPYSAKILNKRPVSSKFSVGISVDCASFDRIGKVKELFDDIGFIVNIDHHFSNENFGDLNWINSRASSTSEMIYALYKEIFDDLDKKTALCIYTGIVTDTGFFSYSSTSAHTHKIASELVKVGVSAPYVYTKVYSAFISKDISYLGGILSNLKSYFKDKLIIVTSDKWRESKTGDLTDLLFSVLRNIFTAEIFVFIKRLDKENIKINFRSKHNFDVNKLARVFDGGGHKKSAGAVTKGTVKSINDRIVKLVKTYFDL